MSAENFTQQVGAAIAQGFIASGIAFGTKLGLFKGLAELSQSRESAVTSQQLAEHIQCKERYVREWINGMVCGGIVDHTEVDGTNRYWLEPYRLSTLLGDTCKWPAVYAELMVAGVQGMPMVEKCFPVDGPNGTNVNDYPDLHAFLARRGVKWHTPENCKLILDDDVLHNRLEQGIQVLEMGCGAADPTKALATCFPKSTFVASDLSQSILDGAHYNCKDLTNISYQVLDACDIPADMEGKFDLVMLFDVYHDVPQPQKLVDGALRLLKKGGQFIMNEVDMHESVTDNKNNKGAQASLYYAISTLYCVPTCISDPNGEGLGACGGKELYERRLKRDFVNVKKIGEDFGLYFLCSK